MADTPVAEPKGKSQFGFLTRKIGPLPVWAYAAIAVGAYYWYTHYGPGASKKAAAQSAGQRPQIIVLQDKDRRRVRGSPQPGPPPNPPPPKPRSFPIGRVPKTRRRPPVPRPIPFTPPPVDQTGGTPQRILEPVTAAAPMTAGDIYGDIPTASIDGTTYDSGTTTYAAAQPEGTYVPAG